MRAAQWVFQIFVCVLGLSLGPAALAADAPKPAEPKTLAELDAALAKALKDKAIPGMGVAIIEGNAIVFAKGYGLADVAAKTPVTEETMFRAGSISKVFVGLSAMALAEEGKLSLDATFASMAPEVPVDNPFAGEAPLKLVHLLEHTSGWADYTLKQFATNGRGMPLSDAVLKDSPYTVRYAPGQYFAYANPGTAAAALMVERAAGVPYRAFVEERWFRPMGMGSATYDKPARGLAVSYLADGKTSAGYLELAAPAVGALNVTPRDLAQYPLLMLGRGTLNGKTYVSAQSVERIERTETTLAARLGLKHGYGLNSIATHHAKGVFRGHGGAVDGALALAEYLPGQGVGFVLMWTKAEENSGADAIRNYLTRNLPKPAAPKSVPVPGGLQQLTGTYKDIAVRQPFGEVFQSIFDPIVISEEGGQLLIDGKRFTHTGGMLFQREDRAEPSLVFDLSGPAPRALGGLAGEKIPADTIRQRELWLIVYSGLAIFAVLHVFVWLFGLVTGRLKARGGVGVRLLPFLALMSPLVLIGIVSAVSAQGSAVLLPALGTQSYWSMSIFVTTLAIPVFGFLSFWRGLTSGYGTPGWVKYYALAAGATIMIASMHLHEYGWVGLMTWAR